MPATDTPHLPPTFNRLAWSNLAAQSAEQIALAAAPIVAVLLLGVGEGQTGLLQTALTLPFILFAICFALAASVGAVIVRRADGHPVGVLVLAAGTAYAAGLAAEGYAKLRAADGELDLGTALASWLDLTAWRLAAVLLAIALALFPERRPTSIVSRVLVVGLVADGVVVVGVTALTPGPLDAGSYQDNPFGVSWLDVATWGPPAETMSWVLTALAVASVVLRYFRAPAGARRQLRWPAAAAALLLVGLVVAFLGFNGGIVLQVVPFVISVVALPAAMAAAILADHLYDIDVIINRLVVYLLLAGTITINGCWLRVAATCRSLTASNGRRLNRCWLAATEEPAWTCTV